MWIYALIITLLFGSENDCQYGDLTLWEDMSYRIVQSDNVQVCNVGYVGSYFTYTEVRLDGNYATVRTTGYTPGMPFPESVTVESLRYDVRWLQYNQ